MKTLLCLLMVLMLTPMASAQTPPNILRVEVVDLHNDEGSVDCALFSSADGFPGDMSKTVAHAVANIRDGRAVCEMAGMQPGSYAVSVIHDENSNGRLDTTWYGKPREGVGASNDAHGFFGPPKFDAAGFYYRGGTLTLTVHIVYL